MEAEEFMNLFDLSWFGSKDEVPTTAMLMFLKIDDKKSLQLRSSSERSIRASAAPDRQTADDPELQKVEEPRAKKRRRGRRHGLRRSLSALEFEEVKGFMDLGFVFDEVDKNSGLVSIIPGLQKWREMGDGGERICKCRPCCVLYERERKVVWKMPSTKNDDVTMKDHLRFWAHAVASNVK